MINASGLYKTYIDSGTEALLDVSFSFNAGKIIGLLGPNGAGKSTLIRVISTILKFEKGELTIDEFSVKEHPLEVRKKIAVALQYSSVEMWLSVYENLIVYGKFYGYSGKDLNERIDMVIELFQLNDYVDTRANELSGGFRKRLQLARCFLCDSEIIILDEPTAGLDPIVKEKLYRLLRSYSNEGKLVILATQQLDEVEKVCDEVVIINEGNIVIHDTVNEVKKLFGDQKVITLVFEEMNKVIRKKIEDIAQKFDIEFVLNKEKVKLTATNKITNQLCRKIFEELDPAGIDVTNESIESIFIRLFALNDEW